MVSGRKVTYVGLCGIVAINYTIEELNTEKTIKSTSTEYIGTENIRKREERKEIFVSFKKSSMQFFTVMTVFGIIYTGIFINF